MRSSPDEKRFARYQSVVNTLLAKESFNKPEVYKAFGEEEKPFIGKVIGELVRDGYLIQDGLKTRPRYSWSEKKKAFNPGRWIVSAAIGLRNSTVCLERVKGGLLFSSWGGTGYDNEVL